MTSLQCGPDSSQDGEQGENWNSTLSPRQMTLAWGHSGRPGKEQAQDDRGAAMGLGQKANLRQPTVQCLIDLGGGIAS